MKRIIYLLKRIIKFSRKWLKQKSISVKSVNYFLDNLHDYIEPKKLNEFRMFLYNEINNSKDFQNG